MTAATTRIAPAMTTKVNLNQFIAAYRALT